MRGEKGLPQKLPEAQISCSSGEPLSKVFAARYCRYQGHRRALKPGSGREKDGWRKERMGMEKER